MDSLQSPFAAKLRRLVPGVLLTAFFVTLSFLVNGEEKVGRDKDKTAQRGDVADKSSPQMAGFLTSRPPTAQAPMEAVKVGDDIVTAAGQRRRLQLADGSILFVNQQTEAKLTKAGHLTLKTGEIYVEIPSSKNRQTLKVTTPHKDLTTAEDGSHFDVRVDPAGSQIVVARGSVAVAAGELTSRVKSGQLYRYLSGPRESSYGSPRLAQVLDWTRELMLAAESPLIPGSEHAGGALIVLDPKGQGARLELRKFHIDVYIEDGFARTTIDQTYFNQQAEQLEGTFYFPLPPDASLSRLAMYVDGNLREGGMAERDLARQTYENFRYYNRDPALLEWVDGSTFKMRVFPIEARQEKRLVLSYTQVLPNLNGQMQYRFPAGHSLQTVKDWSFRAQIKDGKEFSWSSPSHKLVKVDLATIFQAAHEQLWEQGIRLLETQPIAALRALDHAEELYQKLAKDCKGEPEREAEAHHALAKIEETRAVLDIKKLVSARKKYEDISTTFKGTRFGQLAETRAAEFKNNADKITAFYKEMIEKCKLAENDEVRRYLEGKGVARTKDPFLTTAPEDLVLSASARNARTDKDVVLALSEPKVKDARFSTTMHDGAQYFMARIRLDLREGARAQAGKRDWVFLFEASGDRDPLLARVQIDVIRHLLHHVSAEDRFTVLTANTRVKAWSKELQPASTENVLSALAFLEGTHLIGALDLGQALSEAAKVLKQADNPYLVHLGSGVAAMGERRHDDLIKPVLSASSKYVGVGVGRRWDRSFMKAAAERTGGHFTQINPDEQIPWRSFELFAGLSVPRLQNIEVRNPRIMPGGASVEYLPLAQSVGQGEEICVVAKFNADRLKQVPEFLVISGQLDGKPWTTGIEVKNVTKKADYLPRTWAKLEIDRLLTEDATKNKETIIALSKSMYVMTPFTSLLVLENDDQHVQFKIDFGRKDHWAMYACPPKMEIVYEPLEGMPDPKSTAGKKPTVKQVLRTIALGQADVEAIAYNSQTPSYASTPASFTSGTTFGRDNADFRLRGLNPDEIQLLEERFLNQDARTLGLGFTKRMTVPDAGITNLGLGRTSSQPFAALPSAGAHGALTDNWNQYLGTIPISPIFGGAAAPDDNPVKASVSSSIFPHVDPTVEYRYLNELARPVGFGMDGSPRPQRIRFEDFREQAGVDVPPAGNVYLPNDSSLPQRLARRAAGSDFLYRRPKYEISDSLFFDLSAYAPAMTNSIADIEAVLEAAARPTLASKPGKIDPQARELFSKARSFGWQSWTLPAESGQPEFTIVFDGSGKYAYERLLHCAQGEKTAGGIRELVTCDGQTLLHLYPLLGIGAQRTVSRFHRADFADVVPWALPDPADLAHGFDLKVVAERTVAIVSHQEAAWNKRIADIKKADKKDAEVCWHRVHLVFGEDGKLAERQLVKMPKGEVVSRRVLGPNGVVQLLDAKGKEVSVIKGKLSPARAPSLAPDTKDLVVLPLPYRTAEHVLKSMKGSNPRTDDLRFKDALPLFAAYVAAGNANEANRVFRQVFYAREQRQLGFYVLLAACGLNLDSQNGDVLAEHLENPVAQYLALHSSPVLRKHASQWAMNSDQWQDGFLQHLGQTHAILQRWESPKVLKGTPAKVAGEKSRALEYVRKHKDSAFAWALLCRMQDRADQEANPLLAPRAGENQNDFHVALAECWDLFKDTPGLKYAAQYERARSLCQAGRVDEARKNFRALYEATLKEDRLPSIDEDFRRCMQSGAADDPWSELVNKTARHLLDKKHRPAVLALARQVWHVEDQPLAQHLLTTALAGPADGDKQQGERTALTVAVIEFLAAKGQVPQADELLQKLLAEPKSAERADLWRLSALLAERRDMPARGIECLEKALDVEFRRRASADGKQEVVDLEQVRRDYGKLLNHYQSLADAMVALKLPPPDGFLTKVVRQADRWRALDSGSGDACQLTANVLQRLGQRELGWDYLTTPIGLRPNEAQPWWELAGTLGQKGELKLADRAYQAVFAAEPTNAQILWDRAQNLRQAGEEQAALRLYRQLAEGTWQPRFQGIQTQARSRLKGS